MPFSADWLSLLEECDALPEDATLITPLSDKRFEITDSQEHCIIIEFVTGGETQPLQREQFETLADRIDASSDVFDLQRLPPDAEPYTAVLNLHPRYECNERDGTITKTDNPTSSQLTENKSSTSTDAQARVEPDLDSYADMLLLIDALERHDPTALSECETPAFINHYTLLSDVQRTLATFARRFGRYCPIGSITTSRFTASTDRFSGRAGAIVR